VSFTISLDSRQFCDLLWMASCEVSSSSNDSYFIACTDAMRSSSCVPAMGDKPGYAYLPAVCDRPDGGTP
jgi:hypothetical protein